MQIASYFGEHSIGAWESDTYCAAAFRDGEAVRLDLMRRDEHGGITWDQIREIKNACGYADKDAIEFYPREADVINTGNRRHIYIFDDLLPLVRRKQNG